MEETGTIWKWKLFTQLKKWDFEKISVLLLAVLALQPLAGLVFVARYADGLEAINLAKAEIVRVIGWLGLVNVCCAFSAQIILHGKKAVKAYLVKTPWNGLALLLLLWSLISAVCSQDTYLALFGGAYRYEGYITQLAYAGIFFTAQLLHNEKYRKFLIKLFSYSSAFLAMMTLMKELTQTSLILERGSLVLKYSSTFVNSNHYGYYLALALAASAGLFVEEKGVLRKILSMGCFLLNAVVLMFNNTLGAFLAILAGLILLFILVWIRKGFKKALWVLIPVAILIGLAFLLNSGKMIQDVTKTADQAQSIVEDGIENGTEGLEENGSAGSGRFELWLGAIRCALDHPVLGVGSDNIQYNYSDYGVSNGTIPHNEYLQLMANCGIPALIIFLTGLGFLFVCTIRRTRKLSVSELIVFITAFVYAVSAFVGVSLTISANFYYLFLGLTAAFFAQKNTSSLNDELLQSMKGNTPPESQSSSNAKSSADTVASEDAATENTPAMQDIAANEDNAIAADDTAPQEDSATTFSQG